MLIRNDEDLETKYYECLDSQQNEHESFKNDYLHNYDDVK